MEIRNVMTRNVEVIAPEATIQEAAQKMRAKDVGALPVCDGDRLAGMVTDRDIAVRATAEGHNPQRTKVRDVMTPKVVFLSEHQAVETAARVMEEMQVRRLPVLSRDSRLVGIVSLGDLAMGIGDERLAGRVLKEVSMPSQP